MRSSAGLQSRRSYSSTTGGGPSQTWRKVVADLEGWFMTVAYDAYGWDSPTKHPQIKNW